MSTRRSGDAYAPEPTVRSWRVLSVQVYRLCLRRPLEVPVHLLISAFGCRCTFAHSSTLDRPAMRSVFANPPLGRRNTGERSIAVHHGLHTKLPQTGRDQLVHQGGRERLVHGKVQRPFGAVVTCEIGGQSRQD